MSTEQLNYPFAQPPALGRPLEVAPGVYWLRMPLPFALDHINLWVLQDGYGWALIDTGIGNDMTREHWEGVFRTLLQESFVTRLIVTHHHPDQAGNAAWLSQRWGVPRTRCTPGSPVGTARAAWTSTRSTVWMRR
jgi:glyoxylase-like metal-dependent hydrolase (beta-lactamase superfamily II)